MEIKDKIMNIVRGDKKTKIFVILAFIGIGIILLSEYVPTNNKPDEKNDYSSYIESLEVRTNKIISSISGVGKCKVMLTLKSSNESIYAKNVETSDSDSSCSSKSEYVFYDGNNGDSPVLVMENMPIVQGVAVVCEGGDNTFVKEQIISAISSLYNISTSNISISKLG